MQKRASGSLGEAGRATKDRAPRRCSPIRLVAHHQDGKEVTADSPLLPSPVE